MRTAREVRRQIGLTFPRMTDAIRNARALLRSDKSQYGEQDLLRKTLPSRGTFLEVGAFQPVLLSNTWALHRRGWTGLSLDANGALAAQWRLFRPGDRFEVTAVVPRGDDFVTFYALDTGAAGMSSTVRAHAESRASEFQSGVTQQQVRSISIGDLLTRFHREFGAAPDLLHLDVEGLDAELLDAFIGLAPADDWPTYVLVELLEESEPPQIFRQQYERAGSAGPSHLFLRRRPASHQVTA